MECAFDPDGAALIVTVYGTPVGVPGIVTVDGVWLLLPEPPPPQAQSPKRATRMTEPKTKLIRRWLLKTMKVIRNAKQTVSGRSCLGFTPNRLKGAAAVRGAVVLIIS